MDKLLVIIKELGIPTILGGILGFCFSEFQTWKSNRREDLNLRRQIAKDIFCELYSWNITATNKILSESAQNELEKVNERTRWLEATERLNKIEALSNLLVSKSVADLIEKIKMVILEVAEEIKINVQNGAKKGTRQDLKSGEKYDNLMKELREKLVLFIEKGPDQDGSKVDSIKP